MKVVKFRDLVQSKYIDSGAMSKTATGNHMAQRIEGAIQRPPITRASSTRVTAKAPSVEWRRS